MKAASRLPSEIALFDLCYDITVKYLSRETMIECICEKLGLLRNPDTTLLLLAAGAAQPVVGLVW